jgi:type IV secretory pathway VirB4 component
MIINQEFGDTKSLVEIKEIKDDIVILKNGGLRQILIVGGINFALKSEEEQNIILETYQNFLNSLEFSIQIVIHSRKINIDDYIKTLKKRADEEESSLLKSQIEEYIDFVKAFVKNNDIMIKTFLVVVPYTPPAILEETKGWLSNLPFFKTKNSQENKNLESEEEVRQNAEQLRQRSLLVIEGLASIGLDAMVLNNEELIELFYNYYNPETIEKKGVVKAPSLK